VAGLNHIDRTPIVPGVKKQATGVCCGRSLLALAALGLAACEPDASNTVYFDVGNTDSAETFWNAPFPSDLRLDANGAPDIGAFPNPRNVPILSSLLSLVPLRRGWPLMSAAYFRFSAPPPAHDLEVVFAGGPAWLIDIDPSSDERGTSFPVVVKTLANDAYAPDFLVAIAPRPGIVLRASTQYAYVLTKDFAPGFTPPSALATTYPTLGSMLDGTGIAMKDVLVATVFTTGDETARIRARSEAIRAAYEPVLSTPALVGGDTYDGFCRLSATITVPQFQTGTAPFDTDGLFVLDDNDIPMKQGELTIPVVITLPKQAMPAAGWPLYQFFHGSGSRSTGLVDLGPALTSEDITTPGLGPGYVVATQGIAAASSALPVNPERVVNAGDYDYLNINNLSAFPQTFQQGVFEQRLLLDALLALRIPDAALAGCTGITTTGGEHFFDPTKLVAGGQSMGGMYTNMVASVEERYGALVPTGAGGFWNLMILEASLVPGARALLGTALGVDDEQLTFVHPALDSISLAWEAAEPITAMSRLAHRPLPGFTARHIYEPVPNNDENFTPAIYDAAALAYGNQQAGPILWGTMQEALRHGDLAGVLSYPVTGNRNGKTQVVVQFEGDGIVDPHYIYRQLETVKHQYSCFLGTYIRDGVPTVPPPNVLAHPCQ
jgi:hypothetical protein